MSETLFLFVVISVSLTVGAFVGRRIAKARFVNVEPQGNDELRKTYFKGLNYLLNEKPDQAIDSFVQALEVNGETLETHLALGGLLRRKGETERAIRVHQNILARPGLSLANQQYAQYELARDFVSAGLLDRAERILLGLVESTGGHAQASRYLLVEIYEDEREWLKALKLTKSISSSRFRRQSSGSVQSAHYCCELAEAAFKTPDFGEAERWISQAYDHDKECSRADLFAAQLAIAKGEPKSALAKLKEMVSRKSEYVPEAIELLDQIAISLDKKKAFLASAKGLSGSAWLISMTKMIELEQGQREAVQFLGQELKKRKSSLRGLLQLTHYHVINSKGSARESLEVLQTLLQKLDEARPVYRCKQCGFSGKKLHWHCPSCRGWGTIRRIRAVDGE